MKTSIRTFTVTAACLLLCAQARAGGPILTADSVVASSTSTFPVTSANSLIDGSGIIGHLGQTEITTTAVHREDISKSWLSQPLANDRTPTLDFFFESSLDLCELVTWNITGTEGANRIRVEAFDGQGGPLGNWLFDLAFVSPGTIPQNIAAEVWPLGTPETPVIGVSSVRISILSNFGGDAAGLSEVHFTLPQPGGPGGRDQVIKVVRRTASVKYFVPDSNFDQTTWMLPGYNDSDFFVRPQCLGYDVNTACDGLILYHTMDSTDIGGSTIFDRSNSPIVHNGSKVEFFGGILNPAALIEEGLEFPGDTNNYLSTPHHAELDPGSGELSCAFWVRPLSSQAPLGVLVVKGTGAGSWGILGSASQTQIAFQTTGGTNITLTMPGLPVAQWSHVAFTINRETSTITGYLDGVPRDTKPITGTGVIGTLSPLFVMNTPVLQDFKYRAVIDDFAMWDRALKGEEVEFVHSVGAEGNSFKDSSNGPGSLYGNLIATNVGPDVKGINSAVQVRADFSVPTLQGANQLILNLHYDDGVIVYLNGTEVARRNAPTELFPSYDAKAISDRPDVEALTAEVIDLTPFINRLNPGNNVLAIHWLNADIDADRMLLCAELCLTLRDCKICTEATDFWITFPENAPTDPTNPLEIKVCITGNRLTTGTVEIPNRGISGSFTIPASRYVEVTLPAAHAALNGDDVVEDKGVHITASAPVAVYGLTHINYSTDTYLGLPTEALGTEYIVLGYKNAWTGIPLLNGTQLAIVACEDETLVQIVPSVTTVTSVDTRTAGVPYYITLQSGETYQLRCDADDPADLSGTEIRADKPIGVFGGHRCANIDGSQFFCDTIVEHLLPLNLWGLSYVTSPLATRLGGDTIRVIAGYDNTDVFVNTGLVATLNRGEIYQANFSGAAHITASRPILVGQYSRSADADPSAGEDADPFFIMVQRTDTWVKDYTFCAPPTGGIPGEGAFALNYVNVAVPAGSESTVFLDGVQVDTIAAFAGIPPSGAIRVAAVPVANPGTPHRITGQVPFGISIYGFATYHFDSYGHPGGMCWFDTPPRVSTVPEMTVFATHNPQNPGVSTAATPNIVPMSSAADNCDAPSLVSVSQRPRAGSLLAVGTHRITVSAIDTSELEGATSMVLHVMPPWAQTHFPNDFPDPVKEATVWGEGADPDGDGLDNGLEAKLGTDPNDPASGPSTVDIGMVVEGGLDYLTMEFLQRVDPTFSTCFSEGSTNLVDWQRGPGIMDVISTSLILPGGEFEYVVVRATLTGADPPPPTYFMRVGADPEPVP